MLPFFAPILWACIIAVLFHPLQLKLEQFWGVRPNLTALVTLLACIVLVVIPVLLLLTSFLQQGLDIYQRIDSGEIRPGQYLDQIRSAFPAVQQTLERFNINTDQLRQNATDAAVAGSRLIAQNALAVGQSTFGFVLKLALMLYVAYFLLRDGRRLVEELVHALPLGDERERMLFRKFSEVTRATVKGNLLVAMVQGALGGIIFWILGLPAALLWGVVMTILSLIPAVGAGLVLAAGSALSVRHRPMGGRLDTDRLRRDCHWPGRQHPAPYSGRPRYQIAGLDGFAVNPRGLALFGINGFVVGPLIAVLFIAFWQIFSKEFNNGNTIVTSPEPVTDEIALLEDELDTDPHAGRPDESR